MHLFSSLILIAACFITETISIRSSVIYTEHGPVQGEIRKTVRYFREYSAFRGIRYAKAPIGYSRFKPPEKPEPWAEIFDATFEATPCPQRRTDGSYFGDEDCLNLNVYTPRIQLDYYNDNLLPVMVWIHGGAFIQGHTNITDYGPDFFIENEIVVVMINYRLGALGFLSLNHRNATGNAGLKDQLLALEWVHENIEKFGGDPDRVTIFGHSAGAASVDYHMLSSASKDLFHRSISMSGSHLSKWAFSTPYEAESATFNLAKQLGIATNDDIKNWNKDNILKKLYNESTQNIVDATMKIRAIDVPFKPTLENVSIAGNSAFITTCPYDNYAIGNLHKKPHITGFMSNEALLFAPGSEMMAMKNLLKEAVHREKNLNDTSARMILRSAKAILHVLSNTAFVLGIDMKQKLMKHHSSAPLFYYRNSFIASESIHQQIHHIDIEGAAHEDDMAYIWHMSKLNYPKNPNSTIAKIQHQMTRMWSNFARCGHPTPDGKFDMSLDIFWPNSGDDNKFLDIDIDLKVGKNPANLPSEFTLGMLYLFTRSDECPLL